MKTEGTPGPAATPSTGALQAGPISLALPQPVYRYHAYQGDTDHCGPYAVAIAANAFLGEARFDPLTVAREMNRPLLKARPLPHWVIMRLPNGPTFPWGMAAYLARQGIPSRWHWRGGEVALQRHLRLGLVTIVIIGNLLRFVDGEYRGWAHAKVLYGFDPERGYAFVDPGYRADPADPWACQGIFWQSRAGLLADWRTVNYTMVTVGPEKPISGS